MSFLRFVFDTLGAFRISSSTRTRLGFFMASIGGVGISICLFLLLLFEFGLEHIFYDGNGIEREAALAALFIWLMCVAVGGYVAARLYTHELPVLASSVAVGSIAACITLAVLVLGSQAFEGELPLLFIGASVGTVLATLFGVYIAYALNTRERVRYEAQRTRAEGARIQPHEVAVVIAAHNEELTIGATIQSLLALTTPEHIYIGSDGSTDKTVEVVHSFECHADDIQPNRGKAGALSYVLDHNDILSKYKAVFFLDADITVDKTFYRYTLPYFDDPRVAAASGYFEAVWPAHFIPRWELLITAYRIRLWRVLQFFVRYGQTWRRMNMSPIVPGGASIYRTSALRNITIHVPGLVIEDFNMTFELHHKKLGRIVFEPRARVYDQEPYSVRDFVKQIKRWYLGYFQTMRHHGVWPSFFCLSTYFFTAELLISSVLFVLIPVLLLELMLGNRDVLVLDFYVWGYSVTLLSIFIAAVVIDFVITIGVALVERKPLLLLYGIGFFPLRYVESAVFLAMLPLAFVGRSDGRWESPKRKSFETKIS